jgi:hypothetical protein
MSEHGLIAKLPAPRLQFRWSPLDEADDSGFGFNWKCVYQLVLPLGEHDQRREIYEDGEIVGEREELELTFPGFTKVGSRTAPCTDRDGTRYCETPFRDGAHSQWDSAALGGLPIYVIAPDGVVFAKAVSQ